MAKRLIKTTNIIDIGIEINLPVLLLTKMLIQAGSGGGKSYAVRKTIESVGNKVQQIILDPEGEYVTLREKFNFVLVAGQGGDLPLSVKYAEVLAYKILETRISVIIDLYELPHKERIQFVKKFCEALINAPKELWKECLIYIDEAHVFCPEKTKAESLDAVIDLCTRGRKRGFGVILSTTRLSMVDKDAVAEMNNKLIGRTGLDIDRKRSGDELGMTNKEDVLKLRRLKPGEFFAFGPAISDEVINFKVSKVMTTHLAPGERFTANLPAPNALKKILAQLKQDIPEVARLDLVSKEQYLAEIARLKAENTRLGKGNKPVTSADPAEVSRLQGEISRLVQLNNTLIKSNKEKEKMAKGILEQLSQFKEKTEVIISTWQRNLTQIGSTPDIPQLAMRIEPAVLPAPSTKKAIPNEPTNEASGEGKIGKAGRNMLMALALFPDQWCSRTKIGLLAKIKITGGHFTNTIAQLKALGYLQVDSQLLQITQSGLEKLGNYDKLPTDPKVLISYWAKELGKLPGAMLQVLYDNHPKYISRDQLAIETNVQSSGGHFTNCLSALRAIGLITEQKKELKLNDEIFDGQ